MILIKLQNEKKGQSNEDVKQANGRVSVFWKGVVSSNNRALFFPLDEIN